jgi:hypothetical protein
MPRFPGRADAAYFDQIAEVLRWQDFVLGLKTTLFGPSCVGIVITASRALEHRRGSNDHRAVVASDRHVLVDALFLGVLVCMRRRRFQVPGVRRRTTGYGGRAGFRTESLCEGL